MSGTQAPAGGPADMSPPAPSQLRFEILGPQRAWYADRQLDLGPGKQRAVLAVLLLAAGRPVPTGQIVEAVWPDEPPANGPNVVQKYVAGLRRVLEPDRSPRTPGQVLSLTDAGYLLRITPEAVDAVRFERGIHRARQRHAEGRTEEARTELTAALELWQGEPFTGFAGPYFETARHRLVELRAVALETRVELELAAGRHRELVGGLVELVAEFPVRERLRHQLMLALYRSGRQAEALAAYRDFGDLLREEYGIEPGEALQELHRRILRSDPTLTLPAADMGPFATTSTPQAAATDAAPASVPEEKDGRPVERPLPAPPQPAAVPSLAVDRAMAGEGLAPPMAGSISPAAAPPLPSGMPPVPPPAPFALPVQAAWPSPNIPSGLLMHPPLGGRVQRQSPGWVRAVATIVGAALALLSVGSLTWAVVLAYALWRRSWRLAVAAIGYLMLLVSAILVAAQVPEDEDFSDLEFLYLLAVLATCWILGAAHVVLLNPTVWSLVSGLFRTTSQRVPEQQRVRREQARYLLHHHPAARHELRIGRPDLPRTFDDGGLIDLNAVPDQVLAGLPGLTGEQRRQIAVDRWLRGPYGSMEELAARCLLPPALTDSLRDILVFLPPPPSEQS